MGWSTFDNTGAELQRSFSDTPIGSLIGYAGASAPTGWLTCDGSAVNRTTYADLFSVIGTSYGTGNGTTTFNLPDAFGFIIYAQSISERIATATAPQYVTSLPTNPVDGQTVVYAADASNGVMWTLRYRAASSSSYKWEFVGGPPLGTFGASTNRTTTSPTYTALTGEAIEVTVPLAGDYRVEHGFPKGYTTAAGGLWQTVKLGSAAASDEQAILIENAKDLWGTGSLIVSATGLAASAVLALQHKTANSGTGYWQRRWLTAVPVRVG